MSKSAYSIIHSVMHFTVASALLALSFNSWGADSFSSLEERMTGKDFTDAGLDKLDTEELATLNLWLHKHLGDNITLHSNQPAYAGNTGNNRKADNRGFESDQIAKRETIYSHIVGEFKGWKEDTIFELANGQVWKNVDSNSFSINAVDVDVTIKPKSFGSWFLSIDGYNKFCRVRRIK